MTTIPSHPCVTQMQPRQQPLGRWIGTSPPSFEMTTQQSYLVLRCSLWSLICISWQPGIIGQNWAYLLIILCGLWLIIESKRIGVLKFESFLYIALNAPAIYIACRGAILDPSAVDNQLNSLGLSLCGTFVFLLGIKIYSTSLIQKSFLHLIILMCLSGVGTVILYGISIPEQAAVMTFPLKHYSDNLNLFLPFTLAFPQRVAIGDFHEAIRMVGLFREPGVYQAFICTSIIVAGIRFRGIDAYLSFCVLVLGAALTLSTAGIINLIISIPLFFYFIQRGKIKLSLVLIILLMIIIIPYIYDLQNIGISSKISGESGIDRILALQEFQKSYWKSPIFGLLGTPASPKSMSGTILIVYLYFGILGIFFPAFSYSLLAKNIKHKTHLLILFPVTLTALTSQPLWGTLPIYFLFSLMHKRETSMERINI